MSQELAPPSSPRRPSTGVATRCRSQGGCLSTVALAELVVVPGYDPWMSTRARAVHAVQWCRHRLNVRLVDQCGTGTVLAGGVRKNSPGGRIEVGEDCLLWARLITQRPGSQIRIGRNCFINGGCVIEAFDSIAIGDDLLMGPGAAIVDGRSHSTNWAERFGDLELWRRTGQVNVQHLKTAPVVIGDGVWIGANAIVLPGVAIGDGATIGAASVVTKSVPEFTVWAGNPARQVGIVDTVRPPGRVAADDDLARVERTNEG